MVPQLWDIYFYVLVASDAFDALADPLTFYSFWLCAFDAQKRKSEGGSDAQHMDSKGPMGPVFSSHVYEEESADDL